MSDNADQTEDFDAFWAQRERKRKSTTVMGVAVELPASLPLQFELEARRLQRSKRDKDVRTLVGILFGADALDTWTAKGMDLEQLMVLLAWAPQVIAGEDVTLAEVAEAVAKANAKSDGEGKGPDPT
jgi:hypothetical protein